MSIKESIIATRFKTKADMDAFLKRNGIATPKQGGVESRKRLLMQFTVKQLQTLQ